MSTCCRCTVANQPSHKKVVSEPLQSGAVEAFLPPVRTVRCSKDRRIMIDRPIFSGYVFVIAHSDLEEGITLYEVPGTVRIISFKWRPVPIDDREIEGARLLLSHGRPPAPHSFPALGDRARVVFGAV